MNTSSTRTSTLARHAQKGRRHFPIFVLLILMWVVLSLTVGIGVGQVYVANLEAKAPIVKVPLKSEFVPSPCLDPQWLARFSCSGR